MSRTSKMYDVLITGGGLVGLSTALGLARQTYSAIVFDSQKYRDAYADRMHNVMTIHQPSSELLHNATIETAAKKDDGRFEVTDRQQNKYQGRKLVLATGITDVFPDIKGFGDLWGKSIFNCLFCDGFEERGAKSAGVMALDSITQPKMILQIARMAAPLAKDVTIYCHGNSDITTQAQREFAGKSLTIEPRKIVALEQNGAHVKIYFEDGETKEEAFLVSVPSSKINGPFHKQLGLEVDVMGFIKTNLPFYETSVLGVFAVDDWGTFMRAVPQAIATGSFGAAGTVTQLGAVGRF